MTGARAVTPKGRVVPTVDEPLVERLYPGVERLFYCIGAQKSSTSWLARALIACPDAHVPAVKELHFWNNARLDGYPPDRMRLQRAEVRAAAWAVLASGLQPRATAAALSRLRLVRARHAARRDPSVHAYVGRLMRGYRGQSLAGELTPDYALLGTDAFAQMARLHRDTRFVFILRDPVERLWSAARHFARVWGHRRSGGAISAAEVFAAALSDPSGRHVRRSRYDLTIERLERAVPQSRIHYAFYETIREPAELTRLAAFLDLDGMTWDIEGRVNAADGSDDRPDGPSLIAADAALAPVYDYVTMKFGNAVPQTWRQP